LPLVYATKRYKIWIFKLFVNYLAEKEIFDISTISKNTVYDFINSCDHFSRETKKSVAGVLRESCNWLFDNKKINFSGTEIFPHFAPSSIKLISYFSSEEISKIFDTIDISTKNGKRDYLIVSLITYLGLRSSDIINLKFENIDWDNNMINIVQQKTGVPLSLPLIDEVKFPLIDYIKNARNNSSSDTETIIIKTIAPYFKYRTVSPLWHFVSNCVKKSGVSCEGRHYGPHSFRHSFASNMINNNVPLSAISQVLGHTNTKTTEKYLTIDKTNLEELSLEVPDVFRD
jgi:integrase